VVVKSHPAGSAAAQKTDQVYLFGVADIDRRKASMAGHQKQVAARYINQASPHADPPMVKKRVGAKMTSDDRPTKKKNRSMRAI
jgi:hypothetical protein